MPVGLFLLVTVVDFGVRMVFMYRWLNNLVLVLVLLTLLVSPAPAEDDDPGDLQPRDSPIIIGGDHNYPPYEFQIGRAHV